MAKIKLTPFEEVLDDFYGKIGTPDRDKFEAEVSEAVHAWRVGEAMKKARLEQNLSQEQLGERIGVKKSQISKLESGKCVMTLPTMSKVFRALGIPTASLDLGMAGKVALW